MNTLLMRALMIASLLLMNACAAEDEAARGDSPSVDAGEDVTADVAADTPPGEDQGDPADAGEDLPSPADAVEDAVEEDAVEEDAGADVADVAEMGPPEDMGADVADDSPDSPPDEDMGQGAYAPGERGPWALASAQETLRRGNRQIPVVALIPQGFQGLAPLVVFSPGFQLQARRYRPLCEHLASHGFVVVMADPPATLLGVSHVAMAEDLQAVIDWALAPGGAASAVADPAKVGVMGHSLGGKVSVMVAARDERVGAALALDPVNGGNPLTGYSADLPDIVPDEVEGLAIPLGFVGETVNAEAAFGPACAPAAQNFLTFLAASTGSPWAYGWDAIGADHMDFVEDQSACGFVCNACTPGSADPLEVQAAVRALAVAFFGFHLGGEPAGEAWLTGERVPTIFELQERP